MRRVMLIGLDCVPPLLAFERFRSRLPHLDALMRRGAFARLRSTFPPITVPAWTSMVSGRDPGELGLYGFRQRVAGRYDLRLVSASDVDVPRVWDVLGARGLSSSILFVPPAHPVEPLFGQRVGCFLTPEDEPRFAYPDVLAGELRARFGAYVPDVMIADRPRETLLTELIQMTAQHFAMARHVWENRDPDFMMLVEIGPDRLHHAFFHELADPASDVCLRYYQALDAELGALIQLADEDTTVIVASDHGARPLTGVFHINEWLRREGYLVMRSDAPAARGPLRPEYIDFSRTRAWAEGGYYARIMINLAGREPEGIVPQERYDALCRELSRALSAVRGPGGEVWQNRIERPATLYRAVRGLAPDLLAVFDDLSVRPLATVFTDGLYGTQDDRRNDGANHDWYGIFVMAGAGVEARGPLADCDIHDVGATVLASFGIDKPAGWLGTNRSVP